MSIDEFLDQIGMQFGHVPTSEQHRAMICFARFLADRNGQSLMILRGAAGTGKTTLASAMVRTLKRLGQKTVLLAPTGRAAKVFSLNSAQQAFTIHRRIYRQKSFTGGVSLGFNASSDTLFMVDEASMISANASSSFVEGSFSGSSLLDDLVQFVYSGRNCRLMLIGDSAQLPPVGEDEAPALDAEVMRNYGMQVYEASLNEVMRQSEKSGILWNATRIRECLSLDAAWVGSEMVLPQIRFKGFADIQVVSGDELIETLASSYSAVGLDETIVVTRSNKRANVYNMGIRNTILDREEELVTGDMLMVVRNNYYWQGAEDVPYVANGDCARVLRVRGVRELYGFRFADVWLQFPDYDDYEMQAVLLLDTLSTEAPALTREQGETLFNNVMEDYVYIPQKAERMKKMKEDRHYNALQVKFAYAVTCHKAQGGQWAHVYIDQGYLGDDMLTPDYIHWLYTAFTRATERLYLVNWPGKQMAE